VQQRASRDQLFLDRVPKRSSGSTFPRLDLVHHFGKKLAERGRGGLVHVSAAAAAGGLPFMAAVEMIKRRLAAAQPAQ